MSSQLGLPNEVQAMITNHLHNRRNVSRSTKTLFSAAQVSRSWFEWSAPMLWEYALLENLVKVIMLHEKNSSQQTQASRERQQLYASGIKSIGCRWEDNSDIHDEWHRKVTHLSFSNLRELELSRKVPDEQTVTQYFGQRLRKLSLGRADLNDRLLAYISQNCPRLSTITLIDTGSHLSTPSLLTFFGDAHFLVDISLRMGRLASDDLLIHLAQRPNLSNLAVDRDWFSDKVEQVLSLVKKPFSVLRALNMSIEYRGSFLVPRIVQDLVFLDLQIAGAHGTVMQTLHPIKSLRHLRLCFTEDQQISNDELMSLKLLPSLEGLYIIPSRHGRISCVLSDAEFNDICSSLRDLRMLVFSIENKLSEAVLVSLAAHCQSLQELLMTNHFNTQCIMQCNGMSAVFPCLQDLTLGSFSSFSSLSDEQWSVEWDENQSMLLANHDFIRQSLTVDVKIMERCFPCLEDVYFKRDDQYDRDLLRVWVSRNYPI